MNRDQRREITPLFVAPAPAALVVAADAIQWPVGTPKPDFARLTISSGKGMPGALASAILPAPGLNVAIQGASDFSRAASTSGVRISIPCAIPAQSVSRKS